MLKRRTKPGLVKPPITVDRLATLDEIRGAVLELPDPVKAYKAEVLREIASDMGGYVRLSPTDIGISLLVEDLIQQGFTWDN